MLRGSARDGDDPRADLKRVAPLPICIRAGLPWHDEAAATAGLLPELRQKVVVWNECFSLRYAPFRARLVEIARENWSRIENAQPMRPEDVAAGTLLVPVDDVSPPA